MSAQFVERDLFSGSFMLPDHKRCLVVFQAVFVCDILEALVVAVLEESAHSDIGRSERAAVSHSLCPAAKLTILFPFAFTALRIVLFHEAYRSLTILDK